jgi:hypothetical protein
MDVKKKKKERSVVEFVSLERCTGDEMSVQLQNVDDKVAESRMIR